MGAKIAHPEKTCVNLMGDASIGMVGMDPMTAQGRFTFGSLNLMGGIP